MCVCVWLARARASLPSGGSLWRAFSVVHQPEHCTFILYPTARLDGWQRIRKKKRERERKRSATKRFMDSPVNQFVSINQKQQTYAGSSRACSYIFQLTFVSRALPSGHDSSDSVMYLTNPPVDPTLTISSQLFTTVSCLRGIPSSTRGAFSAYKSMVSQQQQQQQQ